MDNKNIFATNLQKQMEIKNKTRKEICEELGISYYTFSDWVNAKKYPRMDKIELLAEYFNISKSVLIEKDSEDSQRMDVTIEMERILKELHNTSHEMTIYGSPLDSDTRALLISSIENSLRMAKLIKNRNEE